MAYCRKNSIAYKLSKSDKMLTLELSNTSFLQDLCGTHRIQRIPKNSSRRHTSTATIAIIDNEKQEFVLDESELDERFTRGSGNGGQNKNVSDNKVVLTHRPTGIQVSIDSRSQWNSRKLAREEMQKRLTKLAEESNKNEINSKRAIQINPERSAKSFTWNTQRNEVINHETGQKWRMSDLMKGKF